MKNAGDHADQGVEKSDVDHDSEEHNREHQECRGRRHVLDGVKRHVTKAESCAGDETEDGGDQQHGHHWGESTQHDQGHEGEDHGEAEDHEDAVGWGVAERVVSG